MGHAKALLPLAEAGDWAAASVLADVLLELGYETSGRYIASVVEWRRGVHTKPRALGALEGRTGLVLDAWLGNVRMELYPPRNKPCLPNRKNFAALCREHGAEPRQIQHAWLALKQACASATDRLQGSAAAEDALQVANDVMRGHGVEVINGAGLFRGYWQDAIAAYVNMGDTYTTTLLYDRLKDRFYITSWGDWLEAFERKNGPVE
jgi:hypothetical protein